MFQLALQPLNLRPNARHIPTCKSMERFDYRQNRPYAPHYKPSVVTLQGNNVQIHRCMSEPTRDKWPKIDRKLSKVTKICQFFCHLSRVDSDIFSQFGLCFLVVVWRHDNLTQTVHILTSSCVRLPSHESFTFFLMHVLMSFLPKGKRKNEENHQRF